MQKTIAQYENRPDYRLDIYERPWGYKEPASSLVEARHFRSQGQVDKFSEAVLSILALEGGECPETTLRRELAQGAYSNHRLPTRFSLPKFFPLYVILTVLGFTVTSISNRKTNRHIATIISL